MKNIKKKFIIVIFVFMAAQASALETIIQGRIDEMYDDNTNASSTHPISDWTTNMMLGVIFRSEIRALDLSLTFNDYQRYSFQYEQTNVNYQDASLALDKSFSETVTFHLLNVFQHYPESRNYNTLFGRNEAASGYMSNTFSTSLSVYLTQVLFVEGVYNNGIMENDSGILADSQYHNPGGDIGFCFDSANIVKAGYLYTLMKYDDGNQSRGDRGYVEYDREYTRQLRSVLQAGYDYITTNSGQTLTSRWVASLIDDVDINNQLNITFAKENSISTIFNDTFNSWRISGTLAREVSERVRVNLSLFYGDGTYRNSGVHDKLAGTAFALGFVATEFINFNVGYNFTWNSSTAPGQQQNIYYRNQIYAGLSGSY